MRSNTIVALCTFALLSSACVPAVEVQVEARPVAPASTRGRLRFVYLQFPGAPGLLVKSVEPGRSADRAGLRPRDCIMAMGGRPLAPDVELTAFFDQFSVGQSVTVDVVRDGRPLTVEAVLDPAPPVDWRAPALPTPVFTTSPVCMKSLR
jgi:S1-C subfamily serine protease